jgi:hypothetical protein
VNNYKFALRRGFAVANPETFKIKLIRDFVQKHMKPDGVSVDPFARNCKLATITNDLNPATDAHYHIEALDFLELLVAQGIQADTIIFDPPYNPAQAKECYESLNFKLPQRIAQTAGAWAKEKDAAMKILKPDGVFLWFGWNTCGMGSGRGFEIIDFLDVTHGRGKHDTLCIAEKKLC